jgi:hypothetical protein
VLHRKKYDRIDKETFKQKLDQADWNALLGSLNDVDEMCNTLTETFVQIVVVSSSFIRKMISL